MNGNPDRFEFGSGGKVLAWFSMTGPNRFLRRFVGNASEAGRDVEVAARFATEPGTGKTALWFRMTNASGGPVTFTVRSHAYRTDGSWTYTVPANSSTEDFFNAVAHQKGWYDFTVTTGVDGTWSRRYTGHIENEAPSVSG